MPRDVSQSLVSSVLRAGKQLRDAPDDAGREFAVTRLEVAAERSIAQFDGTVVRGFADGAVPVSTLVADDSRDLLLAALRQIQVANTVLAASTGDTVLLDQQLRESESALSAIRLTENSAVFGFAPGSSPTAADFRKSVAEAYSAFACRSAKAIATSVSGMRDRGPGALRDAWSWAKEKLELDKIGGRLVKLGLRALLGAIRLLSHLVPAVRTDALRERVERLIAAVDGGSPAAALAGAAIGADEAARRSDELLRAADPAEDRLGKGVAELVALTTKHGRSMELCDGIAVAIGIAAKFSPTVPHLPVLVLGAQVLLIAAVVVIGRDCTGDAGAIVEGAVA
ncbi:hypothetical protein FPZ12_018075 [Amycolatopsis acidicola]|uniref:Uncharacterized protein n=1 Tax=Amycolatopsis acidicola TaxID=2596893 RepID=A0A5N0V577_9PSEU|nr:hypothetical protein [Amycolatopsis acidicola]KAA9160253.1 hypothetical protein FPZ12_018075 [Amycolatopsis acidicola]